MSGRGAEEDRVTELVGRARAAQAAFADAGQETVDEAVTALAWSLCRPEHARELAELAVAETGLGNVADKIVKKQRKTFGTLRDLSRVRSVGVIEEDAARGLVKFAKPIGVVAAVTPATNPGATPVNKAMMALKGRNAVIVVPSPSAVRTTGRAVGLMRAELARIGRPPDLVQMLPPPIDRAVTGRLMAAVDLVEVNPLALLADGSLVAADCKIVTDGASSEESRTPLERQARALGLTFIELDGPVGVLANGAGLTMATLDMVRHFGGRPAKFLEIGGDAYTKARDALALLLSKPGLKSLVVNFCGAYARTDVMAGGVVAAWLDLKPAIPVFFSVHGTGEDEAVALIRERLGAAPFERAEDAVRAAVEAAL